MFCTYFVPCNYVSRCHSAVWIYTGTYHFDNDYIDKVIESAIAAKSRELKRVDGRHLACFQCVVFYFLWEDFSLLTFTV